MTNAEEVQEGGKPSVTEIGPFTYQEIREKTDIVESGEEITYNSLVHYHYREELSCATCKEDTAVTVPNAALLGAVGLLQSFDWLNVSLPWQGGVINPLDTIMSIIDEGINTQEWADSLFNTVTVRSLLFDGYEPGVLRWILFLYNMAGSVLGPLLPPLPDSLAGGTFGFWVGRNNTKVGQYYTINKGSSYPEKYGSVTKFNNEASLPESWWDPMGPTPSAHKAGIKGICTEIHGTDGQQFHPFIETGEELWLFTPDLGRSIPITYFKDVLINGIETKHYEADETVFSMSNENNFCYCPKVLILNIDKNSKKNLFRLPNVLNPWIMRTNGICQAVLCARMECSVL